MRNTRPMFKRIALGAAGGFAGTLVMQGLLSATQKWLPTAAPPLRQHPGELMVEKAEQTLPARLHNSIPHAAETAAAEALGVGHGVTFGALYAAMKPNGG